MEIGSKRCIIYELLVDSVVGTGLDGFLLDNRLSSAGNDGLLLDNPLSSAGNCPIGRAPPCRHVVRRVRAEVVLP